MYLCCYPRLDFVGSVFVLLYYLTTRGHGLTWQQVEMFENEKYLVWRLECSLMCSLKTEVLGVLFWELHFPFKTRLIRNSLSPQCSCMCLQLLQSSTVCSCVGGGLLSLHLDHVSNFLSQHQHCPHFGPGAGNPQMSLKCKEPRELTANRIFCPKKRAACTVAAKAVTADRQLTQGFVTKAVKREHCSQMNFTLNCTEWLNSHVKLKKYFAVGAV